MKLTDAEIMAQEPYPVRIYTPRGNWDGTVGLAPGTDEELLEQLFRMFNRVDPGDHEEMAARGYHLPSLSVGDRVKLDGREYRCEPMGWKAVTS